MADVRQISDVFIKIPDICVDFLTKSYDRSKEQNPRRVHH